MRSGLFRLFAILAFSVPALACAAKVKPCVTTDQAAKMLNKDICVSAHVYEVVELSNGSRYLDLCPPQTPEANCHLTIVSPGESRADVGELSHYRNMNVQVRGIVQPMHGRAVMLLSHVRQFSGGPPKFRPNPLLTRGFSADQANPPISDPNLRSQGGRRAYSNTKDSVTR